MPDVVRVALLILTPRTASLTSYTLGLAVRCWGPVCNIWTTWRQGVFLMTSQVLDICCGDAACGTEPADPALAFAGILPPGKFYAWDDEPGELPPLYLNMASDKEKKPKWTLVQGG